MRDIESFRGCDLAKVALFITKNQEKSILIFNELAMLEDIKKVYNNRGEGLTSSTLIFFKS